MWGFVNYNLQYINWMNLRKVWKLQLFCCSLKFRLILKCISNLYFPKIFKESVQSLVMTCARCVYTYRMMFTEECMLTAYTCIWMKIHIVSFLFICHIREKVFFFILRRNKSLFYFVIRSQWIIFETLNIAAPTINKTKNNLIVLDSLARRFEWFN